MEYIDIIDDKTGEKTGKSKSKPDVHKNGDWHRATHVWFINSKNEILLQHRSKEMENYPNCWDISSAGHISSGEDAVTGALREVKEELGLDISKDELKMIGETKQQAVLNNGTYIDNEFNNVYLVKKNLDIAKLIKQDEEVQALKWVPIQEFKEMVEENNKDLVPHPQEYALLFRVLNL